MIVDQKEGCLQSTEESAEEKKAIIEDLSSSDQHYKELFEIFGEGLVPYVSRELEYDLIL